MKQIAAKDAVILWNRRAGSLEPSTEVVVISVHQDRKDQVDYDCNTGASVGSWTKSEHPLDHPEGVFANVLLNSPEMFGSLHRGVIQEWLREFSKIEECEWARRMLLALERFDDLNAQPRGGTDE